MNFGHLYSDILNTYTKKEADELLIRKADIGHSHNDLYYTKAEIDASEKINSMALTTGIDITDSNNVITLSVNWSCSGVVAGHGYQRGKLKGVNAPTSYVFGTLLIVDANYNFKGNAIIFVDTSGYVTIVSQITHNESYSYRGSLTYVQR